MKKFKHKNIINRVSSRNKARQSISCFDHCNELTVCRNELPETSTISIFTQHGTPETG